jgi:selenocysteine lyase/cysteine desulfurase
MSREDAMDVATDSAIDWTRVRADFPLLTRHVHGKPLVYFDSANTGQKPESVIAASRRLLSSPHPTPAGVGHTHRDHAPGPNTAK